MEFSATLIPYRLFCPTSLVLARGLSEDAFDPSFDSAEALLQRPKMEKDINCVTLPWKEALLDKEIFPISYRQFFDIWARVLLVAGFPELIRPYAVRVGAGSRLNGMLAPCDSFPAWHGSALLTLSIKLSSVLRFGTTFYRTQARCFSAFISRDT